MESVSDLKLKMCELETKVQMYEVYIRRLESQLDRYDTNLKMSMSSGSQVRGGGSSMPAECTITCSLYETFSQNLDTLSKDKVTELLYAQHPAYASIAHIFDTGLRGPHTQGQLVKRTTNVYCKYMDDSCTLVTASTALVFDKLSSIVFERYKFAAMESTEEYDESLYQNSTNAYNNLMILHDAKSKSRILKEIAPLIQ